MSGGSHSPLKLLLLIILLCLVETGIFKLFGVKDTYEPQHPRLSFEEAKNFIQSHPDVIIVDLRTRGEFSTGHTPNAINIPLYELPKRVHEVPANRPVLLVDLASTRTYQGYRVLRRLRPDITDLQYAHNFLWNTRIDDAK